MAEINRYDTVKDFMRKTNTLNIILNVFICHHLCYDINDKQNIYDRLHNTLDIINSNMKILSMYFTNEEINKMIDDIEVL